MYLVVYHVGMEEYNMTARWIPGWEGQYKATTQGQIISYKKRVPKALSPASSKAIKYLRVNLVSDNTRVTRYVHRLVLETFVGPAGPREETRHLNGDHTDNRLANLVWGTASENTQDRVRHGTHSMARKTHCANGHPYDEANTGVYKNKDGGNHRYCRVCMRERARKRRENKMA